MRGTPEYTKSTRFLRSPPCWHLLSVPSTRPPLKSSQRCHSLLTKHSTEPAESDDMSLLHIAWTRSTSHDDGEAVMIAISWTIRMPMCRVPTVAYYETWLVSSPGRYQLTRTSRLSRTHACRAGTASILRIERSVGVSSLRQGRYKIILGDRLASYRAL